MKKSDPIYQIWKTYGELHKVLKKEEELSFFFAKIQHVPEFDITIDMPKTLRYCKHGQSVLQVLVIAL